MTTSVYGGMFKHCLPSARAHGLSPQENQARLLFGFIYMPLHPAIPNASRPICRRMHCCQAFPSRLPLQLLHDGAYMVGWDGAPACIWSWTSEMPIVQGKCLAAVFCTTRTSCPHGFVTAMLSPSPSPSPSRSLLHLFTIPFSSCRDALPRCPGGILVDSPTYLQDCIDTA
jgi:hypothetical protein